MKYIQLSGTLGKGKVAVVDDEDFDRAIKLKWYWLRGYAQSSANRIKGSKVRQSYFLHRFIMNAPRGFEVDHINHNKLDCRKNNLRVVTHAQNQINMNRHKDNTSGFKGVTWHEIANRWQARISIGGRCTHLGLFDTRELAAKAYDSAAKENYGQFAKLNYAR